MCTQNWLARLTADKCQLSRITVMEVGHEIRKYVHKYWLTHYENMLIQIIERCGWSGGAKVSCILCHRGVQLILAYSWARPAILVVGKGRGGNVFISSVSSLSFLFLFLPCSSLSSLRLSLLTLFSLSQGDDTK